MQLAAWSADQGRQRRGQQQVGDTRITGQARVALAPRRPVTGTAEIEQAIRLSGARATVRQRRLHIDNDNGVLATAHLFLREGWAQRLPRLP